MAAFCESKLINGEWCCGREGHTYAHFDSQGRTNADIRKARQHAETAEDRAERDATYEAHRTYVTGF